MQRYVQVLRVHHGNAAEAAVLSLSDDWHAVSACWTTANMQKVCT
jgi:hypothetical protein